MRPKYASTMEEGEIPLTYEVLSGKNYHPLRRGIFLSQNSGLCVVEQFHSDASFEAVNRQAPNDSKNWQ